MRFTDQICVVTGASRGIGRAIALAFAHEGGKVIVNYAGNVDAAGQVVNEIKSQGGIAESVQADVATIDGANKLFAETINHYGTIDVLVNNAGVHHPKSFFELNPEDWENTFKVNVGSVILTTQRAAKIMLEKKYGKIINISSVRGLYHCGRVGNIDYSASKAAVVSLTKTLAKQLAPFIRVNSVAPGPTETDMTKDWDNETRQCEIEGSYLKRFMQPEEIANAVLFLASHESDAITGEVLLVDGGYSLK